MVEESVVFLRCAPDWIGLWIGLDWIGLAPGPSSVVMHEKYVGIGVQRRAVGMTDLNWHFTTHCLVSLSLSLPSGLVPVHVHVHVCRYMNVRTKARRCKRCCTRLRIAVPHSCGDADGGGRGALTRQRIQKGERRMETESATTPCRSISGAEMALTPTASLSVAVSVSIAVHCT